MSYESDIEKLDMNWAVSCLSALEATANRLRLKIGKKLPRKELAKAYHDMYESLRQVHSSLSLSECDCGCHRPSGDYFEKQAKENARKKFSPIVTAMKAVRDAFMRSGSGAAGVEANKRLIPLLEKLEGEE